MKKILLILIILYPGSILLFKVYSQCTNPAVFQAKTRESFISALSAPNNDWGAWGQFNDAADGCENCRSPYDGEHPGCAGQSTVPGGYAKSQCTAWAYYRTGYHGAGDGGFWAESLPDCSANPEPNSVCRSRTPHSNTIVSKEGTRDANNHVTSTGHVAVVECAYQVNNVWHIQVSHFNGSDDNPCQFAASDRAIQDDTFWDPDQIWFIYRYDGNGQLIQLPGSCGQTPEVKSAFVKGLTPEASEVQVKVRLNGSVCPNVHHNILRRVIKNGIDSPQTIESTLYGEEIYNVPPDHLTDLTACSEITYKLGQFMVYDLDEGIWSEEMPAINLPAPTNVLLTHVAEYPGSDSWSITWDKVCTDHSNIRYNINCKCADPEGTRTGNLTDPPFERNFLRGMQYKCDITAFTTLLDSSYTSSYVFETAGDGVSTPVAPTLTQSQDPNGCNNINASWIGLQGSPYYIYEIKIYYFPNNAEVPVLAETIRVNSPATSRSFPVSNGDGVYGATIKAIELTPYGVEFRSSAESAMSTIHIDCENEKPIINALDAKFCEGVEITWGYPETLTVENIKSFEVYRNGETDKISPDDYKGYSFTDSKANDGRWVSYTVKAIYTDNFYLQNRSNISYSRGTTAKSPPPPGEMLSYEAIGSNATIKFQGISGIDTFLIEREPGGGQFHKTKYFISDKTSGEQILKDYLPLSTAVEFNYKFRPVKDGCVSGPNAPQYTVRGLRKPTSFLASNINAKNRTLTLTWVEGSQSPTGCDYEIHKKTADQSESEYTQVATGELSYKAWIDQSYDSTKIYQYKIMAKLISPDNKSRSFSDFAGPATSIIENCTNVVRPEGPTLGTMSTDGAFLDANWTDNSTPENQADGFVIEYKNYGESDYNYLIHTFAEQGTSYKHCDFTSFRGYKLNIRMRSYIKNQDNSYCFSYPRAYDEILPLYDPYSGNAIFQPNGNINLTWFDFNNYEVEFYIQYNNSGNINDTWTVLPKTGYTTTVHQSPSEDNCAFYYRIKAKTYSLGDSSNWYYFENPAKREGCIENDLEIDGDGTVSFCQWDTPPVLSLLARTSNFRNPEFNWNPGNSKTNNLQVRQSGRYTVTANDYEVPNSRSAGTLRDDPPSKTATASAWCWFISRLCSMDPNEIIGPAGYGDQQFIRSTPVLPYQILFENDPEFAVVPAQRVTITQPIDTSADISSFRLGDFGFRNYTFKVPINRTYYNARIDLKDSLGIYVDILAGIDLQKRQLFWKFNSIDPLTGKRPADVNKGFLGVNDSIHNGEGFVNYTINALQDVSTYDSIKAKASIVFDDNEPIATNTAFNTFDTHTPVSKLTSELKFNNTTLDLFVSGNDVGSGIASYDVYLSQDNEPYELWTTNTIDPVHTFTGLPGTAYKLFSIATDNVGNREPMKNEADLRFSIPDAACKLPLSAEGVTQGLTYSLFEGSWTEMPDFDTLIPAETGHIHNFGMIADNQSKTFGFQFNGFLNIPETGNYYFYTGDSRSHIYLNDTLVVNSDSGSACLYKGLHPLKINYTGENNFDFSLSIRGQWMDKQPVPDSMLLYQNFAPTDIVLSHDSITEHSPTNTLIGYLSAIDAQGGPFEYTLLDTLDNGDFTIHNQGLYSNAIFDYNTKNQFQIRIKADDDEDLSLLKTIAIKIAKTPVASVITQKDAGRIGNHWPNHADQWIIIYPIPLNSSTLNINYYKPENGDVTIKLFTSSGSLIITSDFVKSARVFYEKINLPKISDGIYLLEIHQGNDIFSQPVIIKKN